jgi:hypothetical protein
MQARCKLIKNLGPIDYIGLKVEVEKQLKFTYLPHLKLIFFFIPSLAPHLIFKLYF